MGQRATTRQHIFFWPFDQKMPLDEFLAAIDAVLDLLPPDQRATAVAETRSGVFKVHYSRPMTAGDRRHDEPALASYGAPPDPDRMGFDQADREAERRAR